MPFLKSFISILALLAAPLGSGAQTTHFTIDATTPAPQVLPVQALLGSARSPSGQVLGVNSEYLTLNGKPWLPVMGELHFSRVPEASWEDAILQMKAAGVQIISAYVIWIHHEQTEGQFVWTGNKDLRHFAELCAKHGMYLYPRLGPWAHGEVRNGGLPDWVVARGHIRQNDPTYLAEVRPFYQQIARQLDGLYWKDGGPVIGVQIENEYRERGPGKGDDHIRTLTRMAKDDGIDVPFYTVTGWDGAAIPLDIALPVFGGYPDAPWGDSRIAVTGADVYSFRFANRAAGNMGAIGEGGQSAANVYTGTPFLTAEVGSGVQETYFRRVSVSADDVAAIAPVMLGSGANLLGYYMFHGGRNPDGGNTTLQESQRTAYPTDVPTKSYDFQAPISANGEERESLRRLKLVNYFLNDFGAELAPMVPHAPDRLPATTEDLTVPRVAARTKEDAAFLFVNNYIRNGTMPDRKDFSVTLKLPHGALTVPQTPIPLPSGAYGIWPINLDLGGTRLRYSTAQLFKRITYGGDQYVLFFAIPGVTPEFLLAPGAQLNETTTMRIRRSRAGTFLRATAMTSSFTLQGNGRRTHVLLFSRSDAENIWALGPDAGVLFTQSQFFADDRMATLRNDGRNHFEYGLFGPNPRSAFGKPTGQHGPFFMFEADLRPVPLLARAKLVNPAQPRGPWQDGPAFSWRRHPITLAPADTDFSGAATWNVTLSGDVHSPELSDVVLKLRYSGDVARLSQSNRLLDDDFWNGLDWRISLKAVTASLDQPLTLSVLPLSRPFPMYIQNQKQLPQGSLILNLQSIEAIPQYQLRIPLRSAN